MGNAVLISRRNHLYKSFLDLCAEIAKRLKGESAILDGGIVCLGRIFRRGFGVK
jgi:ATP-dependent DNA ligase